MAGFFKYLNLLKIIVKWELRIGTVKFLNRR
jgi:hypothetical protein